MPMQGRKLQGDESLLRVDMDLVPSLEPLGFQVKRVADRYMRKGGGPLHLLKSTKKERCKLLIMIQMVDLEGDKIRHCVAFDGRVI